MINWMDDDRELNLILILNTHAFSEIQVMIEKLQGYLDVELLLKGVITWLVLS
jgi:hypothetical protein